MVTQSLITECGPRAELWAPGFYMTGSTAAWPTAASP